METNYLESVRKQFEYYKKLGDDTFSQITDDSKLFWQYNEESNSIATVVKHLSGNMLSRWTDFLTSDGEKEWRDRDGEFENDITSRAGMMEFWNRGWDVFFQTLRALREEDLNKTVYIRNQGHTVMEAINRQLAHYPYHVGQIVFIGKMCADKWTSLSIPKGNSNQYNAAKFAKPKHKAHFTDEFLHSSLDRDKKRLLDVHEALWNECASLPVETRQSSVNGKWSPLQHVRHITKGIEAYGRYLQMDKSEIRNKFGISSNPSRTYEDIVKLYQEKLSGGAVSTPRFNPETDVIDLEKERKTGGEILDTMIDSLMRWSEDDLDEYICPHPNLGNLTAREMLSFTILHAVHHTRPITALKK